MVINMISIDFVIKLFRLLIRYQIYIFKKI